VVAAILSFQISPRTGFAALTGISLSLGLFLIFRFALGLGLVAFPKWMVGAG
jgi:putative tricarboxylic transport membrane protein